MLANSEDFCPSLGNGSFFDWGICVGKAARALMRWGHWWWWSGLACSWCSYSSCPGSVQTSHVFALLSSFKTFLLKPLNVTRSLSWRNIKESSPNCYHKVGNTELSLYAVALSFAFTGNLNCDKQPYSIIPPLLNLPINITQPSIEHSLGTRQILDVSVRRTDGEVPFIPLENTFSATSESSVDGPCNTTANTWHAAMCSEAWIQLLACGSPSC